MYATLIVYFYIRLFQSKSIELLSNFVSFNVKYFIISQQFILEMQKSESLQHNLINLEMFEFITSNEALLFLYRIAVLLLEYCRYCLAYNV